MSRVVIAGGGLGGFRVARSLRDSGFDGQVVIVSDEVHLPYDRPPLSKQLLAGAFTAGDCALPGRTDDVDWRLGAAATDLRLDASELVLADQSVISYDHLVLATGRRARPWPGRAPANGVRVLRNLEDVANLESDLDGARSVVVVGAGFIGCEVAATLRQRGIEVSIVGIESQPMPVIGAVGGAAARELHEQNGVRWHLNSTVTEIQGEDRVSGVRLGTGDVLPADVVLVSIGSLPNTEWLVGAGLTVTDGVLPVDELCRAQTDKGPADNVWAVGDIAAWPDPSGRGLRCVEHWSNARDMADTVAANILGSNRRLQTLPAFWSDQYDVKFKSVGFLRDADEFIAAEEDRERCALLIEARREGVVVGAVGLNMNKAILRYQRLLRQQFSAV